MDNSILKKILFYVVDTLEENQILYWLDYGSLLGAYRDGAVLEWDNDIDLGVLKESTEQIMSFKGKMNEDGYSLTVHCDGNRIKIMDKTNDECHLDIFIWERNSADTVMPLYSYLREDSTRWKNRSCFKYRHIENLSEIELYGRKIKCPSDTGEYLRLRYGDDYMTPDRTKRR